MVNADAGFVEIKNLTPHPLQMLCTPGEPITIQPEATPARVEMTVTSADPIQANNGTIQSVVEQPGQVIDLPDQQPGVVLVVSRVVFNAFPNRTDLACPTNLIRNDDGDVIGAKALSFHPNRHKHRGRDLKPDQAERPEHLLVLAGGNPLPNLQAITTLEPQRVSILASDQTLRTVDNLVQAVREFSPVIKTEVFTVSDANDRGRIAETLERIDRGWALSYTGGTKVMSATARLLYEDLGHGTPSNTSVVDGRIRFDDGSQQPLGSATPARSIARLHGHQLAVGSAPKLNVSQIRKNSSLLRDRIRSQRPDQPTHLRSSNEVENLLCDRGGHWIEEVVAALVAGIADEVILNPRLNITTQAKDAPELDVVIRNGWSLTVVSCTVSPDRMTQKHKLFEVRRRAEQFGGERVAAALVCLATPSQIESLEKDVVSEIAGEAPCRIFGRDDLLSWLKSDTDSLRALATGLSQEFKGRSGA